MRFKRSIFLLAAALVGVLLTVQMFAAFNTAEAGLVAAPVSVESAAAVDVAAWETITFDSNAVTYTLTGFEGADVPLRWIRRMVWPTAVKSGTTE